MLRHRHDGLDVHELAAFPDRPYNPNDKRLWAPATTSNRGDDAAARGWVDVWRENKNGRRGVERHQHSLALRRIARYQTF